MIKIDLDVHRVFERHNLAFIGGEHLSTYLLSAVQDTMRESRDELTQSITAEINAPESVIRSRVGMTDVKWDSRFRMSASVFVRPRPIKLKFFSPVQGELGVFYRPYRTGSTQFIRSAFGPNIRRLGRGVFKRTGKKSLPIEREPGLSLTSDPVALQAVAISSGKIGDMLEKNVDRQIQQMFTDLQNNTERQYTGGFAERTDRLGDGIREVSL